jgi:hypothetical protein
MYNKKDNFQLLVYFHFFLSIFNFRPLVDLRNVSDPMPKQSKRSKSSSGKLKKSSKKSIKKQHRKLSSSLSSPSLSPPKSDQPSPTPLPSQTDSQAAEGSHTSIGQPNPAPNHPANSNPSSPELSGKRSASPDSSPQDAVAPTSPEESVPPSASDYESEPQSPDRSSHSSTDDSRKANSDCEFISHSRKANSDNECEFISHSYPPHEGGGKTDAETATNLQSRFDAETPLTSEPLAPSVKVQNPSRAGITRDYAAPQSEKRQPQNDELPAQPPPSLLAKGQDGGKQGKLQQQTFDGTHITAAAPNSADEVLTNLLQTVKQLQQQVEQQSTSLLKQAREAAVKEELQKQASEIQASRQEAQENTMQHEIYRLEALVEEHERSKSSYALLEDPEYAARFEALMRTGQYKLQEVHAALQATRQEGRCSSTRADAYLKSMAANARRHLIGTANKALKEDPPILEDSALGRLLGQPGSADAVDIIVKCKDAHARQRSKAAHSAITAVSAGNLVEQACIKGDALMGRKGLSFLTQVATAVVEDCTKCGDQRKRVAAADTWKNAVSAGPKPAVGPHTERGVKRLTLPFKPGDSQRDVEKPRGQCNNCHQGRERGKWLYFCDECNKGFHILCTNWKHLRRVDGGATWFACNECFEARNLAVSRGDRSKQYVLVDEDIEHGMAPLSAEAVVDGKSETEREQEDLAPCAPPLRPDPPRTSGTAAAAELPPPSTPAQQRQPLLTQIVPPPTPGVTGLEPISGSKMDAKPSIQVKDYFMWEVVPNDWTPKPDSKSQQHPDRGYSKTAYQNWRRKNVSLRDSVKAQGSNLGPLVRGISADMKAAIALQFLKEPVLSWLWPSPHMTERDIDTWMKADPEFKWFEKIPDDQLLQLLDKRFGVKKPDLFLSKKFYDNLPALDAHGDVNYHADVFNRWAVEWLNELNELQKSGCDFADVDLKQTLLNAVSTNKLIHQQALQYNTTSVYLLLSHLRDWVISEEESVTAQRNKKAVLIHTVDAGLIKVKLCLRQNSKKNSTSFFIPSA